MSGRWRSNEKAAGYDLVCAFPDFAGPLPVAGTNSLLLQKVPRSGTVTLRLLKAPGLNLPGSKWEIAYELRMLPESRLKKLNIPRSGRGLLGQGGSRKIREATCASRICLFEAQRYSQKRNSMR